MKKLWPVLLMVLPYVLNFFSGWEDASGRIIKIYFIAAVVICVGNVINAWLYHGERAPQELAFFNMVIKLVHVPFYLMMFLLGLVFVFASVVPALIFLIPIVLITLAVTDGILLITSSMYGVNAIRKARKKGLITKKYAAVHTVFHYLFVLDVISAVMVYGKIRHSMRENREEI